jgi:hypothetical protein
VLDLLGRISVVLKELGPEQQIEADARVLMGLFGRRSTIFRNFERHARRSGGNTAVFSELQLITMAKAALKLLPPVPENTAQSWDDLGKTLLMVNDLLDQEAGIDGTIPDDEGGRQVWNSYLMANGLFHYGTNDLQEYARTYHLFLKDHQALHDHPHYVDLPRALEERTGLSPRVLAAVLFAFNSHWRSVDVEHVGQWKSSISRLGYLTGSIYRFEKEEVERFLALLAEDAAILRGSIDDQYEFGQFQTYHMLPLAKSPLISLGDELYCPSVKLLQERFTRGTYHLFLTSPNKKERRRFLDFSGAVFERYIFSLLERTYQGTDNGLWGLSELEEAIPGKACDAVVLVGRTAFLMECKATLFPLEVTAGLNWTQLEEKARSIFVRGARQLDSTISAIEAGELADLGLDPGAIDLYMPMVVTLQSMPLHRLTYREITSWIEDEDLLAQEKAAAWQSIDVGDMEQWEVGVALDRPVHEMALEKARSPRYVDWAYSNYWNIRGERWDAHNPFLEEIFQEFTNDVLKFFREREAEVGGEGVV